MSSNYPRKRLKESHILSPQGERSQFFPDSENSRAGIQSTKAEWDKKQQAHMHQIIRTWYTTSRNLEFNLIAMENRSTVLNLISFSERSL